LGGFLKKETVIVTLYPGCISFEVALAAELLSEKYQILNATPDGQDLTDSSGLPLKAQLSYAQVKLEDCRAVLVPGGNPDSLIQNKEIDRILIEANKAGLIIGGICAGPSVLGKAGILKGRKIAHGYGKEQLDCLKDIFRDVTLTNELFVVDGNIVTAKPEAHIDFAVEIGCRLDVVDASKSGRLKEYYRGTLGRKIRPLALALIKNKKGQMLLHKANDSLKKETFYRPLGGGIEFHESGKIAVEREIDEELGLKVTVHKLVETFENIFIYEGKPGHEIVMLFDTEFKDAKNYDCVEIDIVESGKVISQAVWRTVEEIRSEGAKLYPSGIEKVLS
jgi:putative intracellular protease/amidase/8-oxo-dGTP pyrophosphatase MutT (NUDIX family)